MIPRILLILCLISSWLYADSVILKPAEEMINTADYIAIVEVQSVESGIFKGQGNYPREKETTTRKFLRRISVRVVENMKGGLPQEIKIHDNSGLWHAMFQNHQDRSKSDSGRYLIFLTGDQDFLIGANGWASTARIEGEKIEWTDSPSAPEIRMEPLNPVLNQIKEQIEHPEIDSRKKQSDKDG